MSVMHTTSCRLHQRRFMESPVIDDLSSNPRVAITLYTHVENPRNKTKLKPLPIASKTYFDWVTVLIYPCAGVVPPVMTPKCLRELVVGANSTKPTMMISAKNIGTKNTSDEDLLEIVIWWEIPLQNLRQTWRTVKACLCGKNRIQETRWFDVKRRDEKNWQYHVNEG